MKLKLWNHFVMSFLYLIPIILTFTTDLFWMTCEGMDPENKYLSLYYLYYSFIWTGLGLLLMYEHSKNLYNVWYCHPAFWIFNFLFIAVIDIIYYSSSIGKSDKKNQAVNIAFNILELFLSTTIFFFWIKTKKN